MSNQKQAEFGMIQPLKREIHIYLYSFIQRAVPSIKEWQELKH